MDPKTGNTSYAVFEIANLIDQLEFCTDADPRVRIDDTYKNTVYDPIAKQLYFQGTVGDCTTGTTSLVMTEPFAVGPPQSIYNMDIALSRLYVGYQGMHNAVCYPNHAHRKAASRMTSCGKNPISCQKVLPVFGRERRVRD